MTELSELFPEHYRHLFRNIQHQYTDVWEIRLRTGYPVMLRTRREDVKLTKLYMTQRDLQDIFLYTCHYSVHAYTNEISDGYLTMQQGHRIGFTGQVTFDAKNRRIGSIRNITSMNIRIANEIRGISKHMVEKIMQAGEFDNTLIISPPGCGKTTFLRDMIRTLSDGTGIKKGYQISVLDERSEIAAVFAEGMGQGLGCRTDILTDCPKPVGIPILVRSMNPEIIAVDEMGGREDWLAITNAGHSGCKILATMHGKDQKDVRQRWQQQGFQTEIFRYFIVLSSRNGNGTIEGIYEGEHAL